jgi:hypothetical protein
VRVHAGEQRLPRPQALAYGTPARAQGPPGVSSADASGRPTEALLSVSLDAIVAPVAQDMVVMNGNLLSIVGERHPMLKAAASQIFSAGGKKLRPVLCFLVARATAQAMGLRCALRERLAGGGRPAGRVAPCF